MSRFQKTTFREIIHPQGQLRVASTLSFSRVHGPGNRFSLWLQGCLRECPGCVNPRMLDENAGNLMNPEVLLHAIRIARDSVAQVEGITLQGGEPVLQARNLIPILERVKVVESPSMNVLLFSGYTIEELRSLNNGAVNDLLSLTDTLIDGEFDRTKKDKSSIRGSRNQRIHHFTDTLKERDFSRRGQEVGMNMRGQYVTGVKI